MAHTLADYPVWLAPGLRTPFLKIGGALSHMDAIAMSVPVVQAMMRQLSGSRPDFAVWGTVIPNLTWSNIGREVLMDAGIDATIPAFSTVMACSTSMVAAFEAAGMLGEGRELALVGGAESMSRIQIGIGQNFSDWIRAFQNSRTLKARAAHLATLKLKDAKLFIPRVANRTTGMSMGEHTEVTVKEWDIGRVEQDTLALASHRGAVAAFAAGFFDDLVIPVNGAIKDNIPRADTSMERLARLKPAFDQVSGKGTLTAGNSSPFTDGAAGLWVGSDAGMTRLPAGTAKARLVDYEVSAVDFRK